jgi:glucokinase
MAKRAVLGFDIGGTKTLCALVDENFRIVRESKFKTGAADGREPFIKNFRRAIRELAAEARRGELALAGAGVAIAGQVEFKKKIIIESPNIVFLKGFNMGREMQETAHLECVVGNDVQLALYGEYHLGAAQGLKTVLGVFFGTGVGGAALINGRIFRGGSGFGGSVGATLTQPLGGADTVEMHGMLDHIASKGAIAGAALAMGVKQWAPKLYKEVGTDISKVSWGALARARKAGDRQIEDLLRARLRAAGVALSSIVNFLNPELLLLGGGLTEELPKLVVAEVENGIREYLSPGVSRALKVKAAKLGNNAGALGAAKLAFKKLG